MKTMGPFFENGPQNDQKHYLEKVFATRFQIVGNIIKPMETRFLKMQKRVAKTFVKPVENQDFGAPFSAMVLKMIEKHYLEKVFATRFQNVGNLIKPMENAVSQNAKTRCGTPYKTCRK